jgi:hypothetical protein
MDRLVLLILDFLLVLAVLPSPVDRQVQCPLAFLRAPLALMAPTVQADRAARGDRLVQEAPKVLKVREIRLVRLDQNFRFHPCFLSRRPTQADP